MVWSCSVPARSLLSTAAGTPSSRRAFCARIRARFGLSRWPLGPPVRPTLVRPSVAIPPVGGRLPIARGRGPMPSAWEAGRIPSPAPSFWGCDTHCLLGWRLGSAPVAWRPGWWLAEAGGSPAAARVRARPASPGLIADGSALIIRDRGAWPRLRATGPRLGLVLVDRVGSTARVPAAGLQVLVGRPLCRWPLDSARDGPVRGQAGSLPG